MMKRILCVLVLCFLAAPGVLSAEARQVDDYTWEGVERIVAVGDLHGDYDHYIETLQIAGLVNKRGKWTGGTAHLVQTGDIPDRGPETRKIMDHIDKLADQAEKVGGHVHMVMGNHETMNVYGDLRYTMAAEFEEFSGRNSKAIRNRYYELVMEDMQTREPEAFAALPENYREQWDSEHPLGWVEHRQAWDPAWNPEGEYYIRAEHLRTAVKVNGMVFVHGGISDIYADWSLDALTSTAHEQLANFNYDDPGMVVDQCGPFWYRGLAGEEPVASPEVLSSILDRLSAERIIVGHTPTPGFVWPRYDGRVVQIDTGIAEHYGGYPAYLEITAEGLFAGYPGGKVSLPLEDDGREAYLDEVIALDPDRKALKLIKQRLLAQEESGGASEEASEESDVENGSGEAEAALDGEALDEAPPVDPCLKVESAAAG